MMLATRWQISNFQQFELSHVKGPLDGAGANLNFQADMAVIRGQKVIQNAANLYEFAQENLKVQMLQN